MTLMTLKRLSYDYNDSSLQLYKIYFEKTYQTIAPGGRI